MLWLLSGLEGTHAARSCRLASRLCAPRLLPMRLPLFLLPLLLLLRLACGSCLAFHNRLLLPPLVHAAAAALIVSCLWLLLALPLLLPLLLLPLLRSEGRVAALEHRVHVAPGRGVGAHQLDACGRRGRRDGQQWVAMGEEGARLHDTAGSGLCKQRTLHTLPATPHKRQPPSTASPLHAHSPSSSLISRTRSSSSFSRRYSSRCRASQRAASTQSGAAGSE